MDRLTTVAYALLPSSLPSSLRETQVALDRVVCCYPLYEELLREALRHAERGFAFSYPRDRWYVRAGIRLENALRRSRRNGFRTFVHPETKMRELITQAGFDLVSQRRTFVWSADVFIRRAVAAVSM